MTPHSSTPRGDDARRARTRAVRRSHALERTMAEFASGQPVRVRDAAAGGSRTMMMTMCSRAYFVMAPRANARERARTRARKRLTTRVSRALTQVDVGSDGVVNAGDQDAERERREANEARRASALASILEPAARERCT
jgi:ribosomal protein L21E